MKEEEEPIRGLHVDRRTLIRSVAGGLERRKHVPEIILKRAFFTWKELKGFVNLWGGGILYLYFYFSLTKVCFIL